MTLPAGTQPVRLLIIKARSGSVKGGVLTESSVLSLWLPTGD